MTTKADPLEIEYAVHSYTEHGQNITRIANTLSRARSTIRRWLQEAGVYNNQAVIKNCTLTERQLLNYLSSKGLNSIADFQKFETSLSLDQQLLNLAPKDWGVHLYKAAVRRNFIIAEHNLLQSKKDAENKI